MDNSRSYNNRVLVLFSAAGSDNNYRPVDLERGNDRQKNIQVLQDQRLCLKGVYDSEQYPKEKI